MTKKIVIVNGHPEVDSLGTALAEKLKNMAEAQGHEVAFFAARDFPLIVRDPAKHGSPAAFDAPVEAMTQADMFVFTSPLWNFSFTSVLKNFLDGVVQAKKFFQFNAKGHPEGLLKTEKVLYVWTSGGPDWLYKYFMGHPMKKSIWPVLKFAGVKKYEELSLGGLVGKGDEKEKAATKKFIETVAQYQF